MHKVGDMERGDYHHTFSSNLMRELVAEYCKRLSVTAGDAETAKFIDSLSKAK